MTNNENNAPADDIAYTMDEGAAIACGREFGILAHGLDADTQDNLRAHFLNLVSLVEITYIHEAIIRAYDRGVLRGV